MGLVLVGLALPATALAVTLHNPAKAPPAQVERMVTSTRTSGVPEVGVLYAGSGATKHTCTASVVHSGRGNTLVTAAHCVAGSGVGMVFVPGQSGARAPYGRWTVTAAYIEPEWGVREDPHADVAFLSVAPRMINGVATEIEKLTGAYDLGPAAKRGQHVTVIAYPTAGPDPIKCATKVYLTQAFPSFDCRGFVSGTSGAPWLRITRHGTQIVGVIGGLNQGGCYDYTSYSPRLGRDADAAYDRALDDAPGDTAPQPGGDGC